MNSNSHTLFHARLACLAFSLTMKNTYHSILLFAVVSVFAGCDKNMFSGDTFTSRRIIPVVKSVANTKAPGDLSPVSSRVIKAGNYDLVEQVYDWNADIACPDTKGMINDSNISQFTTYQFYNDGRGLVFSDTATRSGSWQWSGGEHYWRSVPTFFWSYSGNAGSNISVDENGITATLTGGDDFVVAYNDGPAHDEQNCTESDNLDITFKHAMALVKFTSDGLPSGFKISSVSIKDVYKSATFTVNDTTTLVYSSLGDVGDYNGGVSDDYFVIPQSGNPIIIEWVVKNSSYSGKEIRRSIKLNAGWVEGKKYVYQLGIKPYVYTYEFTKTDWTSTKSVKYGDNPSNVIDSGAWWEPYAAMPNPFKFRKDDDNLIYIDYDTYSGKGYNTGADESLTLYISGSEDRAMEGYLADVEVLNEGVYVSNIKSFYKITEASGLNAGGAYIKMVHSRGSADSRGRYFGGDFSGQATKATGESSFTENCLESFGKIGNTSGRRAIGLLAVANGVFSASTKWQRVQIKKVEITAYKVVDAYDSTQ